MLQRFRLEVLSRTKKKLEKIQQFAARIVTGLQIFACKSSFHLDTSWSILSQRSKIAKYKILFKEVGT